MVLRPLVMVPFNCHSSFIFPWELYVSGYLIFIHIYLLVLKGSRENQEEKDVGHKNRGRDCSS